MPRMYLTPQELDESAIGLGLSTQIKRLAPGVIDKILARCSMRVDSFIEKRLQSPGASTLTATAHANDTSITVASTLTLDALAEQAVILESGSGSQETVLIQSGGVTVTSWQYPYPGTLTLATPLQFGHSNGAPCQYVYKEVREAIKASQSDPYSEALQSQAAQLALAHLPAMHVGLTRIAFMKSYPIQNVYTVEHSYSFDTQYNLIFDNSNPVFTGGIIVESTSGYIRFRVGTVITPEGFLRATYTGGFIAIPDDVKEAMMLYFAESFKLLINPYGLRSETQGKRAVTWGPPSYTDQAECILKKYKRSV